MNSLSQEAEEVFLTCSRLRFLDQSGLVWIHFDTKPFPTVRFWDSLTCTFITWMDFLDVSALRHLWTYDANILRKALMTDISPVSTGTSPGARLKEEWLLCCFLLKRTSEWRSRWRWPRPSVTALLSCDRCFWPLWASAFFVLYILGWREKIETYFWGSYSWFCL